MKAFASTIQVIVAILLSLLILLQQKGSGLGSLAGGGGGEFYATKRGAEKVLYRVTVALAVLFCLNAFVFPLLPDSE